MNCYCRPKGVDELLLLKWTVTIRFNGLRQKLHPIPRAKKASALNLSATLHSLFIRVLRIIWTC